MSLIFNIIIIFIINVMINMISFNHIKLIIDDYNHDSTKKIDLLDTNINTQIKTVKDKQTIIEKSSKSFETSIKNLEKNKINTEELSKKNTELEESFNQIKNNFEENKISSEELSKKNIELEESFSEIKNNLENNLENVYNELKNNKSVAGSSSNRNNINEVRFLSKIKNTNFINIENDKVNMNKIDTHVCTIKKNLFKNQKLDIKEKIKYNYSKILNVSSNIYDNTNNNILHLINPSKIKIIDGHCIVKDDSIITDDNQTLCIYLHIICDKYSFNL